jgi:hypothetical protein
MQASEWRGKRKEGYHQDFLDVPQFVDKEVVGTSHLSERPR